MILFINGKTYEAGELIGYVNKLEKENAELKEESKKSFNDWLDACNKYGKVNLKLTKVKELLQKCLNTYLRDPELRSEVEEFLKEEK